MVIADSEPGIIFCLWYYHLYLKCSVQVFSESPNHSAMEPEHARIILANPEALHKGAVYTRVAEGGEVARQRLLADALGV